MNRASPVEMRKALQSVEVFRKAGILFVALPVLDDADRLELVSDSMRRLDRIIEQSDEAKP